MPSEIPIVPPVEALAYFRRKGFAFGFAWQDVWQEEHARAFTVAKAMSRDLLEDIRAAVDRALAEGRTLDQFRDELRPLLEARGWWGRREMIDPLTTRRRVVQLGSPRRLKTIFQVNLRMAYQAGRWERMERNAGAFPFVRYVSAEDSRVRPQHQAWHGTIKPIGDPWWDEHYPPCGWNCRCTAVPVNRRMMERRGWTETERPPAFLPERYVNPRTGEERMYEAGISPGFGYNVGRAYLDDLAAHPIPSGRRAEGEAATLTEDERAAAFLGPFGLDPRDRHGAVFVDDVGHPLAITPAWAREAAGFSAAELARAGRAIAEPDEIRQLWSEDASGRRLLTRAYVAGDVAVLVNRAGWRVVGAGARRGTVQTREAAETFAERAIADRRTRQPRLELGPPAPRVLARLAALGRRTDARQVILDHGYVVHTLARHAADSRGQRPIAAADVALARVILNRGTIDKGDPPLSYRGLQRIVASAEIGGASYRAVYELRRGAIVLVTILKR